MYQDVLSTPLTGHYLGGGHITCTILIKDDIYTVIRSHLLIYSARNATLLHVQKLGESEVTGLAANPLNSQQLFVGTRDGVLGVWDMTDWCRMDSRKVGVSVSGVLAAKQALFIITKSEDSSKEVTRIQKHCPTSLTHLSDILTINKPCANFTLSPCGGYILYTRGTKLRVVNTTTCATFTRVEHGAGITCVAVHGKGNVAAIGDTDGKIGIIQDWNVKGKDDITLHHWHANQVGGLSFAPRSEVLFSGGAESVLVKWLEGQPQFLPRIGQGIRSVLCPDSGDSVILITADSALYVISLTTWEVKHKLCNVLKGPARAGHVTSSGHVTSVQGSVVFSSTPGKLQIYNVEDRKHEGEIDVTSQNQCTGHDKNNKLSYIHVTHFKICGAWLVTVERRDDGFTSPENRLKFWSTPDYTLVRTMDPVHSRRTTSLSLGSDMAVTTSLDKMVKVWCCEEGSWALGRTLQHRSGSAYCSVLSPDSSVLCVGYRGAITLYSTLDWSIPGEIQPGTKVSDMFITGYHLLVSSETGVSVYDMTSLSLVWEVSSPVSHVLPLPGNLYMVFSTRKALTDVFIVNVGSAEPVSVCKFVCPGVVEGACVLESSGDVVMLTSQQELYTLSDTQPAPIPTFQREYTDTVTVFTELLKISSTNIQTNKKDTDFKIDSSGLATEILNVPSNALPPISSICSNILSDFLPSK